MKRFPPRPVRRRLVREELLPLSRFLAAALRDGSPLAGAVKAYASDLKSWFRLDLELVAWDLERGVPLSEALRRLQGPLPDSFLTVLKAGEVSEDLPAALDLAAEAFEHERGLRARLLGPFTYAAVLSAVLAGTGCFMLTLVAPTFEHLYSGLSGLSGGTGLPWPTRVFISLTPWARGFVYAALAAGLAAAAYGWTGRELGIAARLCRLPPLAGIMAIAREVRFALMLSRLLRVGAPMDRALELSCRGSGLLGPDPASSARFLKSVRGGERLSRALAAAGASSDLSWGVSLGETREDLPAILEWLAALQEARATHRINCLVPVAERSANILLGLLVGFFALAMYAPLFGLASQVGP